MLQRVVAEFGRTDADRDTGHVLVRRAVVHFDTIGIVACAVDLIVVRIPQHCRNRTIRAQPTDTPKRRAVDNRHAALSAADIDEAGNGIYGETPRLDHATEGVGQSQRRLQPLARSRRNQQEDTGKNDRFHRTSSQRF